MFVSNRGYNYYYHYHYDYYNYSKIILITSMMDSSSHSVWLFLMGENPLLWDGYVSKSLGYQAESRLILRFAICSTKTSGVPEFFTHPKFPCWKEGKRGNVSFSTSTRQAVSERAMNLQLKGFTPLQRKAEDLIFKWEGYFSNDLSYICDIYIYIKFFVGDGEQVIEMEFIQEIWRNKEICKNTVGRLCLQHGFTTLSSLKNCPSVFLVNQRRWWSPIAQQTKFDLFLLAFQQNIWEGNTSLQSHDVWSCPFLLYHDMFESFTLKPLICSNDASENLNSSVAFL